MRPKKSMHTDDDKPRTIAFAADRTWKMLQKKLYNEPDLQ
jgi:hypothetical protein